MNTNNIFYFLVGLLSAFYTRVFGLISFGEILVVVYVLWLLLTGRINFGRWNGEGKFIKVLLLLGVALVSAFVSSLLNGSSDNEILKYIGTIILLPFSFLFFRKILMDEPNGMIPFTGFGLSVIIVNSMFIEFSDYVVAKRGGDFQQFQDDFFAYTICNLAYVINAFFYYRKIKVLFLLNLILALLCLIGNSRHLCLMLVIQDFLLFLIYHINKREIVVSFSRIISWGISLVLVLAIVYKGYAYLAESGALGEYGKWKYENQKKEKGGIASSRNEPIRALCTLSHYPLGGLKNAGKEVSDNYEIRKEYAQIIGGTIRSDKSLTGHSAILDWWVIYGIFTFPFWIYILKLLLESLKTMFAGFNNPLLALVLYSSLTMFWNILFSPFGGRIGYGMGIMLILYNLSFSQQKK